MAQDNSRQPPVRKKIAFCQLLHHVENQSLEYYRRASPASVVEDDGSELQRYPFSQFEGYGKYIADRQFRNRECLALTDLLVALNARDDKDLFWAFIEQKANRNMMRDVAEAYIPSRIDQNTWQLDALAGQLSKHSGGIQAFFVLEAYLAGTGDVRARAITEIMRKHGIAEAKIRELTHGISVAGYNEAAMQEARKRPNDNGTLDYTDEDYAAAKDYRERCIKEVLSLIKEHGAEEEFNAYLNQIAPHLMQEDSAREQIYVDDCVPKYWYVQDPRALETLMNGIRPGNMVSIYLERERLGHWASVGVIQDKSGKYRFAVFDPAHGLSLCSNKEQAEAEFKRMLNVYISSRCAGFVANKALAMETFPIQFDDVLKQFTQRAYPPSKTTARIPETSQSGVHTTTPSGVPSNASQAAQALPQAPEPSQGDTHSDSLWHHICQKVAYAFSWLLAMVTCNLINLHYHDSKRDNKDDVSNTPPAAPETISGHVVDGMHSSNISNDHNPNATLSSAEAASDNRQRAILSQGERPRA